MDDETDELTAPQVAQQVGVSTRTLRKWTAAGLLDAPPFLGAYTVYGRAYLAKALAVRTLRDSGVGIEGIKEQLAAEEAAAAARVAEAAAAAAARVAEAAAAAAAVVAQGATSSAAYPAERWERVVLMSGLELMVSAEAGALVRRLAGEIYAQFGVGRR